MSQRRRAASVTMLWTRSRISLIVNLGVVKMSTLSVWNDGFDTRFNIIRKYPALFAEHNGAKMFWKTFVFRLKSIETSKFRRE